MNNQNLLSIFNSLLGGTGFNQQNNNQNNSAANNTNHTYNITEYPSTIFTKQPPMHNMNNNSYLSQQNGGQLFNSLNMDSLKNILPLLLGKSGNMSDLLNKFSGGNNNISQIFSALTKQKKQDDPKSAEQKTIIDLSEYTEVK